MYGSDFVLGILYDQVPSRPINFFVFIIIIFIKILYLTCFMFIMLKISFYIVNKY